MKKSLNRILKFITAIFILIQLNLFAQESGKQVLKSLQDKFETINDLSVSIVQKSGGKESGLSGRLSYKKEDQFILDMKNNSIISDGSTIWNYNKKENKVIINSVDESDPSYFSFNSIVYNYPDQCNLSVENKGEILVLTPKENSDLKFSKAKLWLNEDKLITKLLLQNNDSGNIEISFSDYKLNQNLSDSKFKFTPPEGSSVIDLR